MSGRGAPLSGEAKGDVEMNGHEVEMVLVEHEPLIKGSVTTKRQRSYPTDEISELDEPGSSGTNGGSEGGRSAIQKRLNSKGPERLDPFSVQYLQRSFREVLLGTRLNILLLAVPAAIIANQLEFSPGIVFAVSLVGITPLAERLGYVTEQLAMYTGPTAGGLLNATFGNATEMIISLFALYSGKIRVVQLSLLGSILSNMLLVLGCAFLAGGFKFKTQKFNKSVTQTSSGLLLMSVMGLLFPATLHVTHTEAVDGTSELTLSRFSACIMLVSYAIYLFFQLHSHKELYDGDQGEDDDDDEEAIIGFWGGITWLAVITVFISILSAFIVDAIDGAAQAWHLPVTFISVIILPIVGNAAEHASAVVFAMKDHLDLSLGVAIGSSTQIAMFVIPFCVVVGGFMGQKMDLNFHVFETSVLFITVLVVAFMLQEGRANYFKGLMLVFCYLIVGASFYVHTDHDE